MGLVRRQSLNSLLLVVGLGSLIALSLIFILVSQVSERSAIAESLHERGNSAALRLKEVIAIPLWNFDFGTLQSTVLAELKSPDIRSIEVFDENGRLVVWANHYADGSISSGIKQIVPGPPLPSLFTSRSVELDLNQKKIGRVVVSVSADARNQEFLARLVNSVFWQSALSVLTILAVLTGIRWMITRRIISLAQIVGDFSKSGFTIRAPLGRQDEIGLLAMRFNSMAQTISEYSLEMESLVQTRTSQLVEAEKLAFLGSLVAGFAHEINTPVGVAVTAVSYLSRLVSDLGEKFLAGTITKAGMQASLANMRASAALIEDNLARTNRLVQTFRNVGFDQMPDDRNSFELRDFLIEAVQTLEPKIRHTAQHVRVDAISGIRIFSSPNLMYQILSILVVNALTHAYSENQAAEIVISAQLDDNGLDLTCRDFGIGIAPDLQSRLFTPFFTTRHDMGSLGLGLYIAYTLVKKLEGTISCTFPVDGGCLFKVRFPNRAILPVSS